MANKKNVTKTVLIIAGILLVVFFILPIFFLLFLGVLLSATSSDMSSGSANVAIVPISGVLLTSASPWDSSVTSSAELIRRIEEVKNNDRIRAVIFEINSPGGSGVASDEIAKAIQSIDKPTVAYIREVGASGGYWVASASDKIFANRFSTIGSIGVIGSYLEFSGLLERYNVSYERFVSGENKDFGSPFKEPNDLQRKQFQTMLDSLHELFIEEVARNRNLPVEHVRSIADGSIYTGMQSLDIGLIDGFGGRNEAISHVEELLGIRANVHVYGRKDSIFSLFSGLHSSTFYTIGQGIGHAFLSRVEKDGAFRT